MFGYLGEHPEVCGTSLKTVLGWKNSEPPYDLYQRYFSHCSGEGYLLEAAPTYFARPSVAKAIKRHFGSVKIIIILREPAGRLYSNYKYEKSLLSVDEQCSFMDFVKASEFTPADERDISGGLSEGFYWGRLSLWFELFGADVKVMFLEDLKSDPRGFLEDICGWLNIDASFYADYEFHVKNRSIKPKSMRIHKAARQAVLAIDCLRFIQPVLYARARQFVQAKYCLVNTKPDASDIPDEEMRYLDVIYHPHNVELRNQLIERDYSDLPAWLAAAE